MADTPFIPFTRPSFDQATIDAVGEVLRSGWVTSGPKLAEFESALSDYFGGRPVRCFANGTATMKIALQVAGIGEGDEVITTPISWVATSNVILGVGAKPVFVDIDPITRNLDLAKVAAVVTSKTRAIMPVYLAGLPVNMDELHSLAKQYKLRVIEDAAQAIGSTWKGHKIGSIGDLVSFSFQANKNLSTVEGGCLVFNNLDEAKLAEKLRLQGVTRQGMDGMDVDVLGGKDNLTDVNAVIGLHQLKQLPQFQAKRAELARHYFATLRQEMKTAGLESLNLELPPENFTETNWHMFQVVLPLNQLHVDRAQVMTELKEMGIGTGVHYPAITGFSLYKKLGYQVGATPIAERIGKSILTLPLFPGLTQVNVEFISKSMVAILKKHAK
ncbi:DegT/DnrJ/EryC1/StrS aminotransferase family protein [Polynucleobacter paneuropaeus]|jgi:dTDP-4-amino-4,6-dideoxygalactose transaminase|uniref:DegT/DnrJ/EryC1/StrS aminotransferase family protein n=1 Tax=Polynucleobacter paneuropaeus TaxID=2527775 RepID=A0A2Z4JRI8_9BURK|nr:DegT/DnrJ/EryC1/StrS aminotransferase family protein [Polynucleobacter paneuropaeus]AWW49390.1 DegT/DnrJ/EryC1/StrS aminotransferase family protein [Polynucleobacter paneuropaeus]MBT8520764.1 DegT/DnrJ/EryC1/StrS aminotransferase family protein [Polynucleobacter paneuropaeus]MBT8606039.1 DegT/DnrJ/EryC1/StrS aminotransferase family protein [Polynucleobacter paneuropaeus]QWC96273.1 DegT/DnrJ/EryC1/StrS aminotransferase family protein [Polynucleobacter paneuropaeus]QWC97993.1 DegT/DnrJ/EryC1/